MTGIYLKKCGRYVGINEERRKNLDKYEYKTQMLYNTGKNEDEHIEEENEKYAWTGLYEKNVKENVEKNRKLVKNENIKEAEREMKEEFKEETKDF